jgi:hypothetical protein
LTLVDVSANVETSTFINEGDIMYDFAIAALAHEHIRDLQDEAAEARLAREATARRRSVRMTRQPSVHIGIRRLWAARSGMPACCVA